MHYLRRCVSLSTTLSTIQTAGMENCSPDPLAAPPPTSQSHGPLLGSFHAGPTCIYQHSAQSHREHENVAAPSPESTNTIGFTHEYNFTTYPSPAQRAAIAVLQEFDNQIALAWLTGLRSFRPDENHWFQPENLSSEQFEAISVLKDCPDDLVSVWLDFTRDVGWYPLWCTIVFTPADNFL